LRLGAVEVEGVDEPVVDARRHQLVVGADVHAVHGAGADGEGTRLHGLLAGNVPDVEPAVGVARGEGLAVARDGQAGGGVAGADQPEGAEGLRVVAADVTLAAARDDVLAVARPGDAGDEVAVPARDFWNCSTAGSSFSWARAAAGSNRASDRTSPDVRMVTPRAREGELRLILRDVREGDVAKSRRDCRLRLRDQKQSRKRRSE